MGKIPVFPLALTSPTTRGDLVRQAQAALTSNPYGNFEPGEIDGEYGEWSARATHRAKYWLGYRLADKRYGAELHAYLTGKKSLPARRAALRKLRLRRARQKPLRLRAYREAEKWVGTKEQPPNSNRCFASIWYRLIGAWCAMFTTYGYVVGAKSTAFLRGSRWAYCPFLLNAAQEGEHYLSLTRDPKRGDLVLFDWDDDGVADHVGFFDGWTSPARTSFTTIEGNTSAGSGGSQSDGGMVARRVRAVGDVARTRRGDLAFIHVGR